MPDPYDHVREAFHTVADGLMGWEDPPERAVRRSKPLGASYRHEDIPVLENAGESLIRAGCYSEAVALFALALRVRMSLEPEPPCSDPRPDPSTHPEYWTE